MREATREGQTAEWQLRGVQILHLILQADVD